MAELDAMNAWNIGKNFQFVHGTGRIGNDTGVMMVNGNFTDADMFLVRFYINDGRAKPKEA